MMAWLIRYDARVPDYPGAVMCHTESRMALVYASTFEGAVRKLEAITFGISNPENATIV